MARTRQPLDEATARQIVAYVRQGAYPQVAAEAAGIPAAVYDEWLRKGEGPRARGIYRRFAAEIRQASAQARVLAEAHVWKKDPKLWLGRGPGKQTAARPGWTREVSSTTAQKQGAVDLSPVLPMLYTFMGILNRHLAKLPKEREEILREVKEVVPELVPGLRRTAPRVEPAP